MTVLRLILLFVFLSISAMVKSQDDTPMPTEDTPTEDDTTPPTVPSGDTTPPTGSPSNCECIDLVNPDLSRCDKPNGFKKCNVRNDQTCPDMFCDPLDRCFSVTACPDVAIPDPMPCEDCTCMDKDDPDCQDDPHGQCNTCDNASPRKICRVPADSKCADKYCLNDHMCYAVSSCGCGTK